MSATMGLTIYRLALNRLALLCVQGMPFSDELAALSAAVAEWEETEGGAVPSLDLPVRWQVYRVRRSCGEVIREADAGCWPGLLAADACAAAATQHGGRAWDYEAERLAPITLPLDEALHGVAVVLCERGVIQVLLPDGLGLNGQMPSVTLYYLHVALRKALETQRVALAPEEKTCSAALRSAVERVGIVFNSALVFGAAVRATSVAALGDKAALYRRVADALEVELARLPPPVLCRPGLPSAAIVAAHELRGGWWQTFTSPDDEASLRITRWVVRHGVVETFDGSAVAVPNPQGVVRLMPQAELEAMLAEELRRLSGWVPVGEVAWCRPCAADGRPMPWPEND